jgi:hypothetical protein
MINESAPAIIWCGATRQTERICFAQIVQNKTHQSQSYAQAIAQIDKERCSFVKKRCTALALKDAIIAARSESLFVREKTDGAKHG